MSGNCQVIFNRLKCGDPESSKRCWIFSTLTSRTLMRAMNILFEIYKAQISSGLKTRTCKNSQHVGARSAHPRAFDDFYGRRLTPCEEVMSEGAKTLLWHQDEITYSQLVHLNLRHWFAVTGCDIQNGSVSYQGKQADIWLHILNQRVTQMITNVIAEHQRLVFLSGHVIICTFIVWNSHKKIETVILLIKTIFQLHQL